MSDEIYGQLTYDGLTHQTLLAYPEIRDRLILLDGWSKTYAMTGWRLGYSVWPKAWRDVARKLAVNSYSCVNASAQFAGIAALNGPQDSVDAMRAEFDRRRRAVTAGLNRLPGVSAVTPKGAFYAFPNISRTGWKAKPLASALLQDAGVATSAAPTSASMAKAICGSPTPTRWKISNVRSTAWPTFYLAPRVPRRACDELFHVLLRNEGNDTTTCVCCRRNRLLHVRTSRDAPVASRLRRRQDWRPRTCRLPENQRRSADRELAVAVEGAIKSIDARQACILAEGPLAPLAQ